MKEKIKQNKNVIILVSIIYAILVYCHFQTFIINDDLPYSLFYRANDRITNIVQIISNQLFDYSHISPRIFIHCIVQFLLIYDKTLWSIINPLVIIGIVCLMAYIVKYLTKINNIFLILGCLTAFLLLYDYKYLVYWVAGSVNYVWVFLLMLLFITYYLKIGLDTKPKITSLICLCLSMLCEAMAIFVICMVLFDYIVKKINKEKGIETKYLIFLVCSLAGFAFILFAPSTLNRLSGNAEFEALSLIDKITIATPVLSMRTFKISIYNIFPLLLIISMVYYGFNFKNKKIIAGSLIIIILYILGYLINLNWLYFIIGILFFLIQSYIFYLNKNYNLWPILISAYAVSFSLVITPDYASSRTNFHFLLILSLFIMYNIFICGKSFKALPIIISLMALMTVTFEIIIYYNIGQATYERNKAIKKVQNGETKVLKIKSIPAPYEKFHIDANSPSDKNYWTYASFEDYYKLPKDIKIKLVR